MPIQTTNDPDRLRCSFVLEDSLDGMARQTEIVTFLQLTPAGIEIGYDHHLLRVRTSPLAPPDTEHKFRLVPDATLQALIVTCVQREWWTHFACKFRVLSGSLA